MANDNPLTQIVGRLTRDPEFRKRRDSGEIITDRHGNQLLAFGLAHSDGYGDDAVTTFYDVAVFNPGLQQAILSKDSGLLKGSNVAVEGTVRDNGNYNASVLATRVGAVSWYQRSKASQQPQANDDADF